MHHEKAAFLQTNFIPLVRKLLPSQKSNWGKMNAQQMVEHVSDMFSVSNAKKQFPLVSPAEHLPKLKEFLWSEKEFRENTKGPVSIIAEEPVPERHATFTAAIDNLEKEVNDFFHYFSDHAGAITVHPVFGELNFEAWVQLHYKHVTHHLKQFGLVPAVT
jgi:hypothetical protein